MDAFKTFTGTVAVLERANVDTDQIIPKQFLKSIERTGFGPALFFDWRYLKDGSPDPAFELNDPLRTGASVLVAGNNFGCGSSREHAVWAVAQYGFKAVIAPWRGSGKAHPRFRRHLQEQQLRQRAAGDQSPTRCSGSSTRPAAAAGATVDLEAQTVTVRGAGRFRFDITPDVKEKLLSGLDAIGLTTQHEAEITAFEATHDVQITNSHKNITTENTETTKGQPEPRRGVKPIPMISLCSLCSLW